MGEISFEDKVVVITGAGNGLGRNHAREFAKRGAKVVVNDPGGAKDGTGGDNAAADAVVAEIVEAGGQAVANYDSVASPNRGQAIIEHALDTYGQIDVLVNNAGILRDKSFASMTIEQMQAVISVHLYGTMYVSQPAFRAMKEAGNGGSIINTSSTAGLFGNFGQTNYGAAKMGIAGFTHVLAIEGEKYGIRVNAIAPVAATRMTEDILQGDAAEEMTPETVTPAVIYLASDQCDLTHKIISCGGGRFALIFVGVTPGWVAGRGTVAAPEEVAANLDTIMNTDGFIIPDQLLDEQVLRGKLLQEAGL